jgi:hypothetical protein
MPRQISCAVSLSLDNAEANSYVVVLSADNEITHAGVHKVSCGAAGFSPPNIRLLLSQVTHR